MSRSAAASTENVSVNHTASEGAVVRPAKISCNKAGVAGALCRELQAGLYVRDFQIWKIRQYLLSGLICSEHFQHIGHAYAHAANARFSAALGRVAGNAIKQIRG